MSCLPRWCRVVPPCLPLILLTLLLSATPSGAHAQGGGTVSPMCVSGCISYSVAVTPDGGTLTVAPGGSYSTTFTVYNTGDGNDTYTLTCSRAGGVTCGTVSPSSVTLDAGGPLAPAQSPSPNGSVSPQCLNCGGGGGGGTSATITVHYSTAAAGSTSGTLHLTATSSHATDQGTRQIAIVGQPTVAFVSPGSGTRAVVHTRTPRLLALFQPSTTAPLDSTSLTVTWRGQDVRRDVRFNRGLLEWPVDSARGLNGLTADSAQFAIHLCGTDGGCTTATQWVVLPNDDAPLVSFASMPLEALGSAYTTTLGGFGVSGVEVGTAVGTPSYVSMGVARSAGLVYSTRQSWPRALVNADLELRWPTGTPDRLKVVLTGPGWGGVTIRFDSLVVDNPTCQTGSGTVRRCRVALQASYAGTPFPTPTPKWLTIETTVTDGSVSQMTSDSVEVVMVDRRSTPYGSGWWPAGVSQLVASGNDRILVSASGAATIFRGNGDSLYLSPPGSFTTLVKTSTGWELRPRGSLARVRFDSYGRYVASVDVSGNRDSVAYVGAGGSGQAYEVSKLIDPVGKTFTFSYTSAGVLSGISDGTRTTSVTIDSATNALTAFAPPAPTGQDLTSHFGYNVYGGVHTLLIAKRWSVLGDTVALSYNARYRPTGATLPQVEDETGTLVHPTVSYAAAELRGDGTFRGLDSAYVEVRDPLGRWSRALLDRWGQVKTSWDTLGSFGTTWYNAMGMVDSAQGPVGYPTRVKTVYDAHWQPSAVYRMVDSAAGRWLRTDSLVHDGNYRLVKSIDSYGVADTTGYDANGRITYQGGHGTSRQVWYRTDGLVDSLRLSGTTASERMTYDATSKNPIAAYDENGDLLVLHHYDAFGRDTASDVKVAISGGGDTPRFEWRRTRNTYTLANQVTATRLLRTSDCGTVCSAPPADTANGFNILSADRVVFDSVLYDAAGRDTARMNETGGARLREHLDQLGRVVARQFYWKLADVSRDSTVYDIAGQVRKVITRRGDTLTTSYDVRGRDTLTIIPGVGHLRKAYDGPAGELTRFWNDSPVDSIGGVNGEQRWAYDRYGRLVADTSYAGGTALGWQYAYDSFERLQTQAGPRGSWGYGYETNSFGRLDSLLTPEHDTVAMYFDGQSRITTLRVQAAGGTLHNMQFNFTNAGNLDTYTQQITSGAGTYTIAEYDRQGGLGDDIGALGPALGPGWRERHAIGGAITDSIRTTPTYDGWNRLTTWVALHYPGKLHDSLSHTFASDAHGNVTQGGGWGQPRWGETYSTFTDRLLSRSDSVGSWSYQYDAAGNLVHAAHATHDWNYGYNALDQLVSVRYDGTLIARYGYDVLGRRIVKRVYDSGTRGQLGYTRYIVHGNQVSYEADSAGTRMVSYVWGPGVDQLLMVRNPGDTAYQVITDPLGSVRELALAGTGTWVASFRNEAYGVPIAAAPWDVLPWLHVGWTGRPYDQETGFYYNRARYYDPAAKRFTQEDPAGDAGGLNRYAYVGGDPLEARDPSGTGPDCPTCVIMAPIVVTSSAPPPRAASRVGQEFFYDHSGYEDLSVPGNVLARQIAEELLWEEQHPTEPARIDLKRAIKQFNKKAEGCKVQASAYLSSAAVDLLSLVPLALGADAFALLGRGTRLWLAAETRSVGLSITGGVRTGIEIGGQELITREAQTGIVNYGRNLAATSDIGSSLAQTGASIITTGALEDASRPRSDDTWKDLIPFYQTSQAAVANYRCHNSDD